MHISGHSWSQLIMHQTQSNWFIIQTLICVKGGAIKTCSRITGKAKTFPGKLGHMIALVTCQCKKHFRSMGLSYNSQFFGVYSEISTIVILKLLWKAVATSTEETKRDLFSNLILWTLIFYLYTIKILIFIFICQWTIDVNELYWV